jgi:serine/threonine protein kinase
MFTNEEEWRIQYTVQHGPVAPAIMGQEMFDLIRRCCSVDPNKRPTMAQVKRECMDKRLVPLEEVQNGKALQGPTLEQVEEECGE